MEEGKPLDLVPLGNGSELLPKYHRPPSLGGTLKIAGQGSAGRAWRTTPAPRRSCG